jgi:MFS family permease
MTIERGSSKRATYLRATLYAILMLIAGFFLVIAFLGGIIGPLLTGNYALFAGGIIFFVLFLVVGTIAKKFEPAWQKFEELRGIKKKTTREALKDNATFIIMVLLTLAFGIIYESYFLSFPPTLPSILAQEILKSILTIDGILIGFSGVVLAQFLWAIHSKGNTIYEQMIVNRKEKDIIRELNEELWRLGKVRLAAIGAAFYSLMPLLASILICINHLPMTVGTEAVSPRTLLFDPILAMIAGIMLLAIGTFQINLLPRTISNVDQS